MTKVLLFKPNYLLGTSDILWNYFSFIYLLTYSNIKTHLNRHKCIYEYFINGLIEISFKTRFSLISSSKPCCQLKENIIFNNIIFPLYSLLFFPVETVFTFSYKKKTTIIRGKTTKKSNFLHVLCKLKQFIWNMYVYLQSSLYKAQTDCFVCFANCTRSVCIWVYVNVSFVSDTKCKPLLYRLHLIKNKSWQGKKKRHFASGNIHFTLYWLWMHCASFGRLFV